MLLKWSTAEANVMVFVPEDPAFLGGEVMEPSF